MAGIFGGVGLDSETFRELAEEHRRRWRGCETLTGRGMLIGAGTSGCCSVDGGTGKEWIAVDGETSAYGLCSGAEGGSRLKGATAILDDRGVPVVPATVAVIKDDQGSVRLAADWSGGFPVYWYRRGKTFAFSSLLGVLASVFAPGIDPVGVVSFVKDGYYVGRRSCIKQVHRVQAGQVIHFDGRTGNLAVTETSSAWSLPPEEHSLDRTLDLLWADLTASVDRGLPAGGFGGLMLSGGWDSRTLLAAALSSRSRCELVGLSHGDVKSRELGIVADVCEETALKYILRSIQPVEFTPTYLQSTHETCGTARFPHWKTSARALADAGVQCTSAGVFGEVLGGHYGPAMSMTGWSKIYSVLSSLMLDQKKNRTVSDAESVSDLFLHGVESVQRFFRPEFWKDGEDKVEAFSGAVEDELARLRRRGVSTSHRLAEAYLTEQRGAQHINGQLRTSRTESPIAVPFAHRELLKRASRIPIDLKIHNRLNQRMLQRVAPSLLDYPLAAVLIPGSAPLVAQEASRGLRKLYESTRWWLHQKTDGYISNPRLSWINFGFLVGSNEVMDLANDFQWDYWNHDRIRDLAGAIHSGSWKGSLHEPVYQLLKMYTLDLDLRGGT